MGKDKKKFSELVMEERKKGNVVYLALDEVLSAPVKDIVQQPADGLLWDLNRDEATALSFMDQEGMLHWVNNFAVALVIRELKTEIADLQDALYHSGYDPEDCIDCGGPPHNKQCRFWRVRHLFPVWFEGQETGE